MTTSHSTPFHNSDRPVLRVFAVLLCTSILLLLSGSSTAGAGESEQDIERHLFLLTVNTGQGSSIESAANGFLLPALSSSVLFHAQIDGATSRRYVGSGTALDLDSFRAAGLSLLVMDSVTNEKDHYLITKDGAWEQSLPLPYGTIILDGQNKTIITIDQQDDTTWQQMVKNRNLDAQRIEEQSIAFPRFPQQIMQSDRQPVSSNHIVTDGKIEQDGAHEATASAGCQNLLTNGDVEGSGGWRFGRTPSPGAIIDAPIHGGARAIQLGVPADGANRFSHSTAYQSVTIPVDAEQATLSYWERSSGAGDGTDYRELLLLRTNFTVLRLLDRNKASGTEQWKEQRFDLSAFRGQTIVLYFNVFNNGSGSRMVNYLDDMMLSTCDVSAPSTTTPTNTPTELPTATSTSTKTVTPNPTSTPTNTATSNPTSTETPTPTATPTNRPTETPDLGMITIRIPDRQVTDQGFVVPLELVNVPTETSIGVVSVDVNYDSTILLASSCDTGSDFGLIVCNHTEPGKIRLSGIAANGISVDTLLANLGFDVVGSKSIARATVGSTILDVQIHSVQDTDGNNLQAADEDGVITFGCHLGDVDCDNELSIFDALLMLQFDVGMVGGSTQLPLPAETLFEPACDANGDSACGLLDALLVLQCLAGETNSLCAPDAPLDDNPLQDEIAEGLTTKLPTPDSQATLQISSIPTGTIGQIEIPVTASVASGLSAATLGVQYDPTQVKIVSCRSNPDQLFDQGICNAAYDIDGVAPDEVRFNALATSSRSGQMTLATLIFEPVQPLDTETVLNLQVFTFADETGEPIPFTIEIVTPEISMQTFMPIIQK
ncbi:hypothetical protein KFU94_18670 [Chloroflexi bacterium TSY]|nr:hypothetical protein [Chloroflexi bacterium TSY]